MDIALVIGVGSLLASAIALTITAMVSARQISAQQHARTADHRAKWCDEFRSEMQGYLSAVSLLYDTGEKADSVSSEGELESKREQYRAQIRAAEASIGLRLNPVVTLSEDIAFSVAAKGAGGTLPLECIENARLGLRSKEETMRSKADRSDGKQQSEAEADSDRESRRLDAFFCPCLRPESKREGDMVIWASSNTCPLISGKNSYEYLRRHFDDHSEDKLDPKFGPANKVWDDLSGPEQETEASRICAETFLPTCMHELTRVINIKTDESDLRKKVFAEEFEHLINVDNRYQLKEPDQNRQFEACYSGVSGMAKNILKSEWERTKEEIGTRRSSDDSRKMWPAGGWIAFCILVATLLSMFFIQLGLPPLSCPAKMLGALCMASTLFGSIALFAVWLCFSDTDLQKSTRGQLVVWMQGLAAITFVFSLAGIALIFLAPFLEGCRCGMPEIVQLFMLVSLTTFASFGVLMGIIWRKKEEENVTAAED